MTSALADGAITRVGGASVFHAPYATGQIGSAKSEVTLTWPEPVKGRVTVTARIDNPN